VVSGVRNARMACRLAAFGSCQYFWIGFQPVLRPSS
jgi:hypothetical protein